MSSSAKWSPDTWRGRPIVQVPDYPDAKALADVEAQLASFPPLVFAGEARNLKRALAKVARRRVFPAAGRRLRRKLRRARRQQHPRFLPPVPADGGGADLCRGVAGGEGRPHRRPVRQAALVADREARRRRIAVLSRRHHQRQRIHARRRARPIRAGSSRPTGNRRRRSTCCARSPPAATPICRTRISGCCPSSRTRRSRSAIRSLPTHLTEALDFMRACGIDPEVHPEMRTTDFFTSHEALLLGYEQAFTRVDSTTGDWYCTSGHMLWIGDRTPAARPRPYRVLPRHQESARLEDRPDAEAGRAFEADRHARSGQRARPADADLPHGRGQGRRALAARSCARSSAKAATWCGRAIRCTATPSRR